MEINYVAPLKPQASTLAAKYALMAFEYPLGDRDERGHFEFAPNATTFVSVPAQLLTNDDRERMAEWMGSIEWGDLSKPKRVCVVRCASERPDVLDGENRQLEARLQKLRQALLLTGPNALVWGRAWGFTGATESLDVTSPLRTVNSHWLYEGIIRPMSAGGPGRDEYWDAKPEGLDDGWLFRWRDAAALVEQSLPLILQHALMSFERAFEPVIVEFKLPDAVRAIEAIIALPRGHKGGKPNFAARVMKLVPEVCDDWFAGSSTLQKDETMLARLEMLYQHRNDCSHGKVPFQSLLERVHGADGKPDSTEELRAIIELSRFEYLAEFVARRCLLAALNHPRRETVFADRDVLEAAWENGDFPGDPSNLARFNVMGR